MPTLCNYIAHVAVDECYGNNIYVNTMNNINYLKP